MSGSLEISGVTKIFPPIQITRSIGVLILTSGLSVLKRIMEKVFAKRIATLEDLVVNLEIDIDAISRDPKLSKRVKEVAFKVSNSNTIW